MTVYVVRKCGQQWSVCSLAGALVTFDDYAEAVEVARLAANVLTDVHRTKRKADGKRVEG